LDGDRQWSHTLSCKGKFFTANLDPYPYPTLTRGVIEIIIIIICHNKTGRQGMECTRSSPTMCNKIKDIKTIIHIIHTKSKIIYEMKLNIFIKSVGARATPSLVAAGFVWASGLTGEMYE